MILSESVFLAANTSEKDDSPIFSNLSKPAKMDSMLGSPGFGSFRLTAFISLHCRSFSLLLPEIESEERSAMIPLPSGFAPLLFDTHGFLLLYVDISGIAGQ